jgi:HEAT repeat protein
MPGIHPDHLVRTVLLLSAVVFAASLSISIFTVTRRLLQDRASSALDRAHYKIRSILTALLEDRIDYASALNLLREFMQDGDGRAVEHALFQRQAPPKAVPLLQNLAEDLGLIRACHSRLEDPGSEGTRGLRHCRQILFGRIRLFAFLARARNADRLGRVFHQPSWTVLVKALKDSNSEVQAAALRALVRIREPKSFPFLIELIRASVCRAASPSDRELTAALARFPSGLAYQLLPLLRDSGPRLRLLAGNVLCGMARVESRKHSGFTPDQFGPEVVTSLLTQLPEDKNPDVRAVAADLLGYFRHEERASDTLVRLLEDSEWYVRLHAARALGKHPVGKWALAVSACLTDSRWQVREAAARALASYGNAGMLYLIDVLLTTNDGYAREQILEQLELSGMLGEMISSYAEPGNAIETRVLDAVENMDRRGTALLRALRQVEATEDEGARVS